VTLSSFVSSIISRKPHVPEFETVVLETPRLILRPPREIDQKAWINARRESRAFLEPWEPAWPSREVLLKDFYSFLHAREKKWRRDQGYSFLLFSKDTKHLVGCVNVNNVVRGAGQYATLGYWTAKDYAAEGYMTEAVGAVCNYGFKGLGLHKILAASLPENVASRRVLQKCGFIREGMARKHLKIAGDWHDHILYGLLEDDPHS